MGWGGAPWAPCLPAAAHILGVCIPEVIGRRTLGGSGQLPLRTTFIRVSAENPRVQERQTPPECMKVWGGGPCPGSGMSPLPPGTREGLQPRSSAPPPRLQTGASCCPRFWAGCQRGEVALGALERGAGPGTRGGLPRRGGQSALGRLRIWSEPKGGWAVFSLSREKERKTTLSIELKIEHGVGQAVAWRGRAFLGLSPALAGLIWRKGGWPPRGRPRRPVGRASVVT